ncbi:hypothetical protein Tco_0746724 [Tanacetum coccineum]
MEHKTPPDLLDKMKRQHALSHAPSALGNTEGFNASLGFFFEIKHAQSEEVQELLSKLVQDLQSINEELAEYINTPSWNLPTSSYDDDDDEYSFATQEYLMTCSTAITPDSPKMDSLIMVDKHLDTIPETESNEFIKSSVENLVQNTSESEDASDGECDLPVCDDFPKSHLITFSNPLFDIDDDCTSSDDESFSEEDIPMENFKFFSNSPKIDLLSANLDPKEDICFIENLMYDNSFPRPPKTLKDDYETIINSNNDYSSSDDDSYEDIDYVDASPPDYELASLEVVEIVIPEVGGIDTDILLTIKDDILREKLLNVNLLIAKIRALKDNPTPSSDFVTNGSTTILFDYSLPDYEVFYLDDDHIEEKSSGNTITHADFSQYDSFIFDLSINSFPPADRSDFYHEEFTGELTHIISPPEYDHFYFKIEPELGNFTIDAVEDIFDNPTRKLRVHVPNVLPTHPTLHLDSDFTISSDSLRSDLVVSFPPETRNKIFNPGIFIRVQSKIFLSRDAFSISFIRDPFFLVIDTLLPFSSKNEDKVVNTGILAAGEEQSPHLSSHRGLKALNECPMMIHGENTPNLGVRHLYLYPS